MRRIVYFLIWINISFYTLCGFMEYSSRNYEIIHENKAKIQINKPDDMDNQEFIHTIITICDDTQTDIFYETIQNAMNGHPTYNIYKTNVNEKFLSVPIYGKSSTIMNGCESFSTDSLENTTNHIVGTSLLHNINVYAFQELVEYNLDYAVYYTNEEMVATLTAALLANDIEVILIRNSSYIEVTPTWYAYRIILGVMLLIAMMFYYFSFKREIVIKKLAGYSNKAILLEEVMCILKITASGIIFNIVLISMIMGLFWSNAILDCLQYMILRYVACVVIIVAEFLLASTYILSQSSATDITGKTKNREIQVISILSKGIVILFCMFNLADSLDAFHRYFELSEHYSSVAEILEDRYYLPFNALSSDIDNNIDYYESQSRELVHEISKLYEEDEILVIDSTQYDAVESGNIVCDFITVNKTYFTVNPIFDFNGMQYNVNDIDNNAVNVFVPDNIDVVLNAREMVDGFTESLKCNGYTVKEYVYRSDTPLHTFSTENGDEHGCIYNAILLLPTQELLEEYSLSLLSGCNYMIYDKDGNPYEAILPIIKKLGLETVIIESESVTEYYEMRIFDIRMLAFSNMFICLLLVIVYIVSIFFHISVYFFNEKKRISVMTVQGYDWKRYTSYMIQNTVLLVGCIIISVYFSIPLYIALGISAVDGLIFVIKSRKWSKCNTGNVLRGVL